MLSDNRSTNDNNTTQLQLTRGERLRRCSIDCADAVEWTHWSVGGEYVKKLILKNTHDKLQVIEYKLPQRKATFFVDFPAPVSLSSGMAYELEIKFRPSELIEFHDFIEISVRGRGSFRIRLDALTPYARLAIPDHHDFEFCAVKSVSTKELTISNSGTVPLDFYWEIPEPFDVQPRMGSLAEGESMTIKVRFLPLEATSVLCRAVCKRSGSHELLACLKLSGIGKFAFVSFVGGNRTNAAEAVATRGGASKSINSHTTTNGSVCTATADLIDFGSVLTKSNTVRTVTLQNKSAVDAHYVVKRTDKDIVCPFHITPTKGVVQRDGTVELSVRYCPAGSGAHAANDFVIQAIGGNTLTLRCRGTAVGPTAALSTSKVEYGDVDLDALSDPHTPPKVVEAIKGKLDRFVTLRNTTDAPIHYQFVGTNPGAAFVIAPFSGTIAPRGSQNIKVSFAPSQPLNYLRRVFLLINDTEQALYLDVLGTAYNAKCRPAPFTVAEAHGFFARMEVGLGRCTPDDIAKLVEAIRNNDPITSEDDAAAREAMSYVLQEKASRQNHQAVSQKNAASTTVGNKLIATTSSSTTAATRRPMRAAALTKILPNDDVVSSAPFVLDRSQVIFRGFTSEGEVVTVRNNASAKATAAWSVPAGSLWSVTPETADVAPFSTTSFRIRLSGSAPTSSFGCFLECYVNFKQMRSFRLVSEDTFCPPHCLILQCQRLVALGDTASAPQVDVPSQLAFPPCHKGDCVLQVVAITNKSDTIAAYSLQIEAQALGGVGQLTGPPQQGQHIDPEEEEQAQRQLLSSVFTCFPTTGVISPKDTILLLMKFTPPTTGRYIGAAKFQFNDNPQGAKSISLRGEGFVPRLEVSDGNSVILFRPTSVGGCTQRTYTLLNPSRIPVRYAIAVQQPLAAAAAASDLEPIFAITPASGVVAGCGTVDLRCKFHPTHGRRFDASVVITVEAVNPPPGMDATATAPSQLICQASGEGLVGVVSVEPLNLAYGHILVGESKSQQLSIFNSSLCDLQYELRWAVKPTRQGNYLQAAENDNMTTTPGASHPAPPDLINGRGVIRARSHVNVHVCLQPNRGTFEYVLYVIVGGSEAIYMAPEPSLDDIARLPHCIASVVGAFPCLQISDVRNVLQPKSHLWRQMSIGAINAQLMSDLTQQDTEKEAFSFEQASQGLQPVRCDLGVDVFRTTPIRTMCRLDNVGTCPASFHVWFPDESDIPNEPWHQTKSHDNEVASVLDAGLFDVFPREGVVPPGGHMVLTMTYKHTRIGEHRLPVMLMLEQGKRVLVVLSARTLEENVAHLYFHHSMVHELSPVAVGDLEPPLQYTELQNLSHQPIQYVLDETSLAEVREANYDFPIFQCLNPTGMIPPMSTMLLSWYFRPLEVKSYEASIKVAMEGEGGDPYVLKLCGKGYHPRKVTSADIKRMHSNDFLEVPRFPTLEHPLLPLRLSMDVLHFGSIPFHSLHRQVVTLRNDHKRDTYLFEWHCVLQYGDQIFDIDPPRGRLQPNESVTCRITLYSGSTSHIIDNPIHCHVLNEDLRDRRQARCAEVEREAAMELGNDGQAADSDSAAHSSSKRRHNNNNSTRPRVRQPVTTIPAKFQNTARLREAIQTITEAVVAEDVDENADDLIYVEVLPTILELLVQTRIMPVDAYSAAYGEASIKSVFFPTLSAFRTTVPPNSISLHDATQAEWSLVHDILEDVVKEVVHHEAIVDAVRDCSEDPVPYFCEMCASEPEDGGSQPVAYLGGTDGENETEDAVASADGSGIIGGDLQCLIEEVLEGAIYGIVGEALADDGVIASVALKRMRTTHMLQQPQAEHNVHNNGTSTSNNKPSSTARRPVPVATR